MVTISIAAEQAAAAETARQARKAAALAALAATRQKVDAGIMRQRAIVADRKELARLELRAAAARADMELASRDDHVGGIDRADSGSDGGYKPLTRPELVAAARDAAAALERARLAHQEAMAAEYGGTTAGRDARRAAVHAARNHLPLPAGHRAALAAQLADGCRTQKWAGNGQAAQIERERGSRGQFTTAHSWAYEMAVGTDARTGTVGQRAAGSVADAYRVPATPVRQRTACETLVWTQDGHPVTADTRDASRDELADAARRQAGTRVAVAAADRTGNWQAPGRSGQVALARAGWTGLEAHQYGQALIDEADAADAAAARQAARDAAAVDTADAYRPVVHAPTTCHGCGKVHAAIVPCGEV